jgi:CheY-like chemotaxis protein
MDENPDQTFIEINPIAINVLIVDDDAMLLDTLCFLVNSMGFNTHRAKDGLEAVEQFEAQSDSISLVIMDVEMPRLGGIEATHRIRELNPSAKVILCSGNTKQDVWKAKPHAFLLKPFMFHDLRTIIQHLLQLDDDAPTPLISEG